MLKKIYFSAFLAIFGLLSAQNTQKLDPIPYPNLRSQSPVQSQTPSFNRVFINGLQQGNEPLFIIDGKISTAEEFRKLNANKIETMEVLKDKLSTDKYGEQGKNGVVLVTLKD